MPSWRAVASLGLRSPPVVLRPVSCLALTFCPTEIDLRRVSLPLTAIYHLLRPLRMVGPVWSEAVSPRERAGLMKRFETNPSFTQGHATRPGFLVFTRPNPP